MKSDQQKFFRLKDLAKEINVSERRLKNLARAGILPPTEIRTRGLIWSNKFHFYSPAGVKKRLELLAEKRNLVTRKELAEISGIAEKKIAGYLPPDRKGRGGFPFFSQRPALYNLKAKETTLQSIKTLEKKGASPWEIKKALEENFEAAKKLKG